MEIKQIDKIIKVWDCGDKSHNHKKKVAAENCFKKKRASSKPKNDKYLRNLKIVERNLFGDSVQELSEKNKLAVNTIKSILKRTLSMLSNAYKVSLDNKKFLLNITKKEIRFRLNSFEFKNILYSSGWEKCKKRISYENHYEIDKFDESFPLETAMFYNNYIKNKKQIEIKYLYDAMVSRCAIDLINNYTLDMIQAKYGYNSCRQLAYDARNFIDKAIAKKPSFLTNEDEKYTKYPWCIMRDFDSGDLSEMLIKKVKNYLINLSENKSVSN